MAAVLIDPNLLDPLAGGVGGKLGGGIPDKDVYVWKTTAQLWDGFDNTPIHDGRCSALARGPFGQIEASGVDWSNTNGDVSITRILTKDEYDIVTETNITVTAKGYKLKKETRSTTETTVGNIHTKTTAWGKVRLARSAH